MDGIYKINFAGKLMKPIFAQLHRLCRASGALSKATQKKYIFMKSAHRGLCLFTSFPYKKDRTKKIKFKLKSIYMQIIYKTTHFQCMYAIVILGHVDMGKR